MTGADAHEWVGRDAWTPQGRGCGPQEEPRHGRHGRGGRGGPGGPGGRGGPGSRGGRYGRPEGPASPFEALADWAFTRGKGPHGRGPRDLGPEEFERIEELMALRRMRGRGPSPFGGPGRGPRGRGRRRRGDVRLAVLRLLAEEPRNGYGLMQTIEERSGGRWRPSPGSMYPTLSQLEDEQLIRSTEADSGRQFEITDAGRAALEERAGDPDPWISEPDADEHAMSELGPLVIGIGKAVWQVAAVADETQRTKAITLLAETRRALYAILAEAPADTADAEPRDTDGEPV